MRSNGYLRRMRGSRLTRDELRSDRTSAERDRATGTNAYVLAFFCEKQGRAEKAIPDHL